MEAAIRREVAGGAIGEIRLEPAFEALVIAGRELRQRIDRERSFVEPAEPRKLHAVLRLVEEHAIALGAGEKGKSSHEDVGGRAILGRNRRDGVNPSGSRPTRSARS